MTFIILNALSGCYLISTKYNVTEEDLYKIVSMPSRAVTSFLRDPTSPNEYNDLVVSMPSRAVTSFLPVLNCRARNCGGVVSMPSRAVTSFLQYPFKNLGFMRFPEPVFAGICQNILTVAHFHAC